ncbi:E3 ubiquitin-protein ligase synoviolin B-like [Anneissia japonica]|uniref:E3 ubiquitin-protein ligase synoviolin B-like n=1 Tax=Anneissia japonica TaxID=1529436 RepID=UPI0014256975|nr:E3 ubiquitin-protein ligase synoviolin B-like [Anneissia japonica]
MRGAIVTSLSFGLTFAVVGHAYYQKKQFYPSMVYLTKSNASMAVLYLQALVFVVLMGKLFKKVFFGQLRDAEMEHMIERSWYAVTETCLAFTVFRDDFSPRFVAMFTLLLFLKCFHWLAEDRVDYMERSPVISWIFHIRAIMIMVVLSLLDLWFINNAYYYTLTKGASVQLVFGFEYAILLSVVVNVLFKYILHSVDLQSENPWENKAVYLLYTELVMGFIKVLLYTAFMAIMIKVHTFPLFAIRPMYLAMRSFKKAVNDVVLSRRAIRNMNTLYPDATPEELAAGDNVCIICREEMATNCKKLPCNHIFHTSCLRSWFQRQQSCPTCRMDVLRMPAAQPQQAQTPQPQQNPNPNIPGMVPPFPGFPFFPMQPGQFPHPGQFPQPAMPFPQQPQNTTGTSQGTPSTVTGETGATSTVLPGNPMFPGMMPPPFMIPPPLMIPPFGVPPPRPPPNFQGLNDEELRAMEGTERSHMEARIECLRSIHTFLDAAMIQIQQYTTVMQSLGINLPESNTTAPTATVSSTTTVTTPVVSSTSDTTPQNNDSINNEAAAATSPDEGTEIDANELGATGGQEEPVPELITDDYEPEFEMTPGEHDHQEIRRRRIQRLSSEQLQTDSTLDSSDNVDDSSLN